MAIRSRSATSFSIRMPKNSSGPACARPSPWSPCAENSIGIWSGFLRDAYNELQPQAPCYVWYGWQSAVAMLGMGELRVLVKRAFDRGFIELHLLGCGDFEEDLKHGIERPGGLANHCGPVIMSMRCSATQSKSCRDGIASRRSTARTGSGGGNRSRLIALSLSA